MTDRYYVREVLENLCGEADPDWMEQSDLDAALAQHEREREERAKAEEAAYARGYDAAIASVRQHIDRLAALGEEGV